MSNSFLASSLAGIAPSFRNASASVWCAFTTVSSIGSYALGDRLAAATAASSGSLKFATLLFAASSGCEVQYCCARVTRATKSEIAAFSFWSFNASSRATRYVKPGVSPAPVVRIRAFPSSTRPERNGSDVTAASTSPFSNAAWPLRPTKFTACTSSNESPAFVNTFSSRYWVMVPVEYETFLPFSWDSFLMSESGFTTIAKLDALGFCARLTATTLTGLPAAWANTSGVSAMKPTSTEPPVCAASTAGPPTNVLHSMV